MKKSGYSRPLTALFHGMIASHAYIQIAQEPFPDIVDPAMNGKQLAAFPRRPDDIRLANCFHLGNYIKLARHQRAFSSGSASISLQRMR